MRRLGIFGAGGHAKVAADTAIASGAFELIGFYDDNQARHGERFYQERCVLGGLNELLDDLQQGMLDVAFVALGNSAVRQRIGEELTAAGHPLATLIHPQATLSPTATLGAGTLVVAGAIINADTRVGDHVIINTRASVDHDCIIAHGVHIAPGATLCGGVQVGERSFVCAGATMIPLTKLPADSTLGAGSTLLSPADAPGVWVGSPARRITTHGDDRP